MGSSSLGTGEPMTKSVNGCGFSMGRSGRDRPSQCCNAIDGHLASFRLPSSQVYSMRMVHRQDIGCPFLRLKSDNYDGAPSASLPEERSIPRMSLQYSPATSSSTITRSHDSQGCR